MMSKKVKAGFARGVFVNRHIERFRELLEKFQPFILNSK